MQLHLHLRLGLFLCIRQFLLSSPQFVFVLFLLLLLLDHHIMPLNLLTFPDRPRRVRLTVDHDDPIRMSTGVVPPYTDRRMFQRSLTESRP